MNTQRAETIVKPLGINIVYDKNLKLWAVVFDVTCYYINPKDFESYSDEAFKTRISGFMSQYSSTNDPITYH